MDCLPTRRKPFPEIISGGKRLKLAVKLAKEGLSSREIAERMNITKGTVNFYLTKARRGSQRRRPSWKKLLRKIKEKLSDEELRYLSKHGRMKGYWKWTIRS